ncbi:MAG: YraN family protein [Bacteroidales bacterium]|jgi:putative endonuclease|nr:YraN family protein [Bacteroidales bacterium]
MVSQRDTGEVAEKIAERHLLKLGYKILDKNWYYGHYELDIVARDGNELVIVEVKSRTGLCYEHPSEAVTDAKIRRIVNAADAYIIEKDLDLETRFDVITIIFSNQSFELEHFKDAYYPTI